MICRAWFGGLLIVVLLDACVAGGGGYKDPTYPENADYELTLDGLIDLSGPLFVSSGRLLAPEGDSATTCASSYVFNTHGATSGTFFGPQFRSTDAGTTSGDLGSWSVQRFAT